ncbi:MAG: hypothetical protein QG646_162 [Euryarchaeota archaeon]|nr:hypothetical protein [Euryarchaeota archaeon]
MADVGNPLHTGKEYDQYKNQWVHSKYEQWVDNNCDSDEKFKTSVINCNYYYKITFPMDSTQALAKLSNKDLNTLYTEIYYGRYGTTTKNITKRSLEHTAVYVTGLARYIQNK